MDILSLPLHEQSTIVDVFLDFHTSYNVQGRLTKDFGRASSLAKYIISKILRSNLTKSDVLIVQTLNVENFVTGSLKYVSIS